jgi:DNA-directed RNA polymerase subunit RPC12/RpoP
MLTQEWEALKTRPVRCLECNWRGTVAEAISRPCDLAYCPQCGEQVELADETQPEAISA